MYTNYHAFMKIIVKLWTEILDVNYCDFQGMMGGEDMKNTMRMLNGHLERSAVDMDMMGNNILMRMSDMVDNLSDTGKAVLDWDWSGFLQDFLSELIEMLIEDYKTESCQNKLREFSFLPKTPSN